MACSCLWIRTALMVAEIIFSICDLSWSASKKSDPPQAAKIALASIAGFFLLINTIDLAVQVVCDIRMGFGASWRRRNSLRKFLMIAQYVLLISGLIGFICVVATQFFNEAWVSALLFVVNVSGMIFRWFDGVLQKCEDRYRPGAGADIPLERV